VLVIGGSVAGLMAGSLFRKAGWDVTVFERAVGDLTGRGAGLGVSEELIQVMERAGARFEPSAGVVQRSMVWMDKDGKVVFEHQRFMVASAWARVYQPLRDALPSGIYRQGMALERVDQDHESVTAIFADGSRQTADLLVAADGVLSTVRRQFLPQVQPRFANYVAWRGLVEERDMPAATLEAVKGHIVFCFPKSEMLLCMCVPGAGDDMRPGRRRMYFIWYRTVPRASLQDLFTDGSGKHHGASIPPPLIRPELVRELKAHAPEVLPAAIAAVVQATAQPLLQAISDMESPRMVFGRVALAGDAAFVVRPHVAGGAGKAALDARCLVDSMESRDIPAGLALYEKTQHDFGSRIVQHSRYLGADLEGRPTERDPRRIIRDYGAPNLLHEVDPKRFPSA
jgi:2-polyprenyl-6-methoxyphenol hydroxylase-like FAD-dependent oxidoreductase